MLSKDVNKETSSPLLRACALETINSYPASAIHVYTDGSSFKANKFAGFGVFMRYPDGTSFEYSDSCGLNCSNYQAEVEAIQTSVQILHQKFELSEIKPSDIIIFSDSKSALEALESPPYQERIIADDAKNIDNLLTAYDVQLTLQWIPGHTNICTKSMIYKG
ncbi:MAG: RNAse HI domain-containing protein [Candidatus Omnitrophica bacterium]|nr:RNAse HI domain-containing protein [Candidatus Omnitrophota bacterium]